MPPLRCIQQLHTALFYRFLRWRARPYSVTDAPAIIFAPHPDDETLGCGGLIALKRRLGVEINIVFLTDGANAPPTPITPGGKPMADLRHREAHRAAAALGVPPQNIHHFLYPDSMLCQLSQQHREDAVSRIEQCLAELEPAEVFIPHHHDHHPDHEAAHDFILTAIRRSARMPTVLEYPIWLGWSSPWLARVFSRDLAGARRLCISSARRNKLRALAAYKSQRGTLPRGFIARFLQPDEIYFTLNPN